MLRGIDAAIVNYGKYTLLSTSPLLTIFMVAVFLSIFASSFGFIIMCTQRFNDELNKQSILDPTTNLYNWIGLKEILEKNIAQAKITEIPLTIAIFDIDNFRIINKQYGVEAGDFAIKQIASYFQKYSRMMDILGRLGGDKFVLILPNTNYTEGYKIVCEIKEKIDKSTLQINQDALKITTSFGIAMLDMDQPNIDELFKLAEQELYKSRTLSDDSYGT
ncbi:MAG: GGDEF domain-containing protein [Anaerolineaceae bacterium]|nr:GGDEF domain-containing protein [Anaerolineaceae bacterium]